MVTDILRSVFVAKDGCGPLCHEVADEVASIARADALARRSRKQWNRQRGKRKS